MTPNILNVTFLVALIVLVACLYLVNRYMRTFFWRITFCVVPLFLAGVAVAIAGFRYKDGEGGFKLGVDLVGGTILVYEIDQEKEAQKSQELRDKYKPEDLAAALKRRIDPNDLKNVTIRPVSKTRVEIILPTGGAHQALIEQQAWRELLDKVSAKWPPPAGQDLDVERGQLPELVNRVKQQHPEVDVKEVEGFVNDNYKRGGERRDVTTEEIQHIKELVGQVGSLEFRILANNRDDADAIKAAQAYIDDPSHKAELERRALAGSPPPPPQPPPDKSVETAKGTKAFVTKKGNYTYSWVEVGREERHDLGLDNAAKDDPLRQGEWQRVAKARNKTETISGGTLVYSRDCQDLKLPPQKRKEKAVEYFILVRDPEVVPNPADPERPIVKAITGAELANAKGDFDNSLKPVVNFRFNAHGGDLFYDLTSKNIPEGKGPDEFKRHLAIILDGQIMSAPTLNSAIRQEGQITGSFTQKKVDDLVNILRSGALPATIKPQPVSENTMGATLGDDTIRKGTFAVGVAFVAILVFMIGYYRFAGVVASVALLANLLLTVAFMVIVQATFTLPGLAGLVLMLGMAVDANVLIYERLREERDRGASLPLAIRNGYDRAFPTIIDTHLSSIFTAIVLYVVGNDQLKGFGVSLTVGLIISLFTSLYMTRLMFDLWLSRSWLHKLSMFRLFSRPNIDFMRIRYYWFTATIVLTLFGISVFVFRLPADLNIDFVGGTAYGGQLTEPVSIQELRGLLNDKSQQERLQVAAVEELPGRESPTYKITYRDENGKETSRTIIFRNPPEGDTADRRAENVAKRARELPDLAVEQIFPRDEESSGDRSRYFTVRTSEKEPELVQASIGRLLAGNLKRIEMASPEIDKDNKHATLVFVDPATKKPVPASPGQVKMLLLREFKSQGIGVEPVVTGEGKNQDDRYEKMRLDLSEPVDRAKLERALAATQREFAERPQPDRLENFDSQLAADTQRRAMYAILASWGAILLYLWFRFGSWTFGLATVCCLIHDLFFTLGILAFCHYLHVWTPGLANALLLQDFKIDLPAVAALLTLVGYSVNDTIVVFDRIREVRGKNPELTPQMINDSVNQTLSRTLLTAFSVFLVVMVLYIFGGEGMHLFAFVMVIGVIVGTYSSIYIASPLLLIFGEGAQRAGVRQRQPQPQPAGAIV
jgi:SecD/SecF fusion protein